MIDEEKCLSCGLRKTALCVNPGRCIINGFSMYRPAKPWKKCENIECGAGMRTIRTKKMSETVVETYYECPVCRLQAKVVQEYIRIHVKRPKAMKTK